MSGLAPRHLVKLTGRASVSQPETLVNLQRLRACSGRGMLCLMTHWRQKMTVAGLRPPSMRSSAGSRANGVAISASPTAANHAVDGKHGVGRGVGRRELGTAGLSCRRVAAPGGASELGAAAMSFEQGPAVKRRPGPSVGLGENGRRAGQHLGVAPKICSGYPERSQSSRSGARPPGGVVGRVSMDMIALTDECPRRPGTA